MAPRLLFIWTFGFGFAGSSAANALATYLCSGGSHIQSRGGKVHDWSVYHFWCRWCWSVYHGLLSTVWVDEYHPRHLAVEGRLVSLVLISVIQRSGEVVMHCTMRLFFSKQEWQKPALPTDIVDKRGEHIYKTRGWCWGHMLHRHFGSKRTRGLRALAKWINVG